MRKILLPASLVVLGLVAFAWAQEGRPVPANIAATTCTNQFVRSIAVATGAATCSTVALATDVSGTLPSTSFPALTGPVTTSAGAVATSAKFTLFFASTGTLAVQNTTAWIGVLGTASDAQTTAFVMSGTCSLTKINLLAAATPTSGQTYTVTVYKNNTTQSGSISGTMNNGSFTATATGSVSIVDGDAIAIAITGSATSGNSAFRGYASGTCSS